MWGLTELLVAAVSGLVLLAALRKLKKAAPALAVPGPSGSLPIFGHLLSLGKRGHIVLTEWRKRYGDVYQIKMANNAALVLSGLETIQAACSSPQMAGRPHKLFNSWKKHERYCAFTHSPRALKYRRLIARSLNAVTSDRTLLESVVAEETQILTERLQNGCGVEAHQSQIRESVGNVIYSLCFGERGQASGDEREIFAAIENMLRFARAASIGDAVPAILFLPSFKRQYDQFLSAQDALISLVKKQEASHSEAYGDGCVRDLCDMFRRAADESASNVVGDDAPGDEDDGMLGTAVEQTGMLLVAGFDTMEAALNWSMLLLAVYPDVQEVLVQHLASVCGSRSATLADRESLPYAEAVIHEVLRFSSVSPLAMPHLTTGDMQINGYFVPRDTLVLLNLWSVTRDDGLWEQANTFNPTRFLSKEGCLRREEVKKSLSFGTGCRKCVGETLALAELFLFVTNVVQKCRIVLKEHVEQCADLTASEAALHLKARNYPIIFSQRV